MTLKIPFNMPPYVEGCMENMRIAAEENHKICGDGPFTAKCSKWLEERMGIDRVLLTSSCTHALEMTMHLLKIEPGDEVITPSYTFCSAADAIALRGGVPVFVDIRPDTMNIDENLIEDAITEQTRAIAVMHNAGVACEMDRIMAIAEKHGIDVVEDAAHAPLATYHGKQLGTFGRFGTFSFHETKNYSMGEGGAILMKTQEDFEAAEILREKGTDRSRFFRGQVDKYRWVDYGSSYLPGDLNAAYLYAQLERADEINNARLARWNQYYEMLTPLAKEGRIDLPTVPEGCVHNAHMFYIKVKDLAERTALIDWLKERGILAVFHYVPLHSSPAGLRFGRFHGEDVYTTKESERLVRLPMYFQLTEDECTEVAEAILAFYRR